MPSISRRRFLVSASGVLVAGALAPVVGRAQTSVKIGTAVLGDYSLAGPFIVAVEKGFFRTENLNVEFVPFRGGPNLVKAVISGEVLLGAAGSTDILVFREAGMPLKMVATHTEGNHFTLNVAPDVQAAGDLKGKSIGVTSVGATTWVFARMVARQQGWDPDRDVKIVGLGGLDAQLAALARKEIHAFVWGDGGAVTQLAGKSKVLMRLDKVTARWISQIQYVSEEGIRKQGDDIRKVMKGLFAAIRYMTDQTAEAAEVISKKIGWSPEAVLAAHKISGSLMSHDGTMSLEALRSMQDTLLEHGVIKKRLPLEEHVAREFTPVKIG
jgi:NitT/TauT family transport system substrate-binding protein